MPRSVLDLIIHPVRLQIVELLGVRQLTTAAISAALPEVPTSSLYRHLRQLLEGGMIEVVATHPVRGIEEKVYALHRAPRITRPDDLQGLSADDHLRYFIMYAASLIESFAQYAHHDPELDPARDRMGYSEVLIYASPEQIDALGATINAQLLALGHQGPAEGRQLRKVSVITHPVFLPDEGNGGETGPDGAAGATPA
jgi:DNA-binding transcriptional ArsR family regulator